MKKRLLAILLLLGVFMACCPLSSYAVNPPHLQSADAVLVVDMNTDTILYELNKDTYHSIASLTKIMTCLLAVEAVETGKAHLEDLVTAQPDCLQGLDVSSSNAGIQPGEVMTYEDLLYCALVHSANDACNVLATYIDGSIGAFVEHMNRRADEIGCRNTSFVDTDGMLNRTEGHYSCPADLYLIAKEAMTHSLFTNICSTADYTVKATNYRPSFEIHNSNALMSKNGLYGEGYLYDGVIGIKTGFTKPAGYCLVSVCQRREGKIMAIVLGCNGPLTYTFAGEYQNFRDSITLYDWAFSNFSNKTMFLAGEPMQRVAVENALNGGTVAMCAADSLVMLVPNDVSEKDITTEIIPDAGALVAPIHEGQELGTINVYVAGEKYSSVRLVADADVELDPKIVRNQKIHDFFTSKALRAVLIILAVLLVALVLLRFYFRLKRRQEVSQRLKQRSGVRDGKDRNDRAKPLGNPAGLGGLIQLISSTAKEEAAPEEKTIRIQRIRRPSQTPPPTQREAARQTQIRTESVPRPAPTRRNESAGPAAGQTRAASPLRRNGAAGPAAGEARAQAPLRRNQAAAPSGVKRPVTIQHVSRSPEKPQAPQTPRKTVIHDMSSTAQNPASAVASVRSAQRSTAPKDPVISDSYDIDALLAEFQKKTDG